MYLNRDRVYNLLNREPAHICHICDKTEYEDANICTTEFWICPECCAKLKELITPKKSQATKGIMAHHE